jgi:hypothetical protein
MLVIGASSVSIVSIVSIVIIVIRARNAIHVHPNRTDSHIHSNHIRNSNHMDNRMDNRMGIVQ